MKIKRKSYISLAKSAAADKLFAALKTKKGPEEPQSSSVIVVTHDLGSSQINQLQNVKNEIRHTSQEMMWMEIYKELQSIKSELIKLKENSNKNSNLIKDPDQKEPGSESINRTEAIENLKKIVATRAGNNGETMFLLHRPTENFEYEKSVRSGNIFETGQDTEWVAEYMTAEKAQKGFNAVVSCWIPESAIRVVVNPHPNTGTWGELGKNPFSAIYKIIVRPGVYNIHQEFKGA